MTSYSTEKIICDLRKAGAAIAAPIAGAVIGSALMSGISALITKLCAVISGNSGS